MDGLWTPMRTFVDIVEDPALGQIGTLSVSGVSVTCVGVHMLTRTEFSDGVTGKQAVTAVARASGGPLRGRSGVAEPSGYYVETAAPLLGCHFSNTEDLLQIWC